MDNVFKPVDVFQSTLSVRRATDAERAGKHVSYISIHALREESDFVHAEGRQAMVNFNPRSP